MIAISDRIPALQRIGLGHCKRDRKQILPLVFDLLFNMCFIRVEIKKRLGIILLICINDHRVNIDLYNEPWCP